MCPSCFYKMIKAPWINILTYLLGAVFLLSFIGGRGAAEQLRASTPPRGWNSYDSFSWTITEEQFLDNVKVVADKLLTHGYEYVVVDYLWYRRFVPGAYTNSLGFDVIDEWGRPIPDPVRWPSSKGGKGFTNIADRVHKMGLKFGIHVMRGISTQAVNANTPIMGPNGLPYQERGRNWRASDIGLRNEACKWMSAGFMSVDPNLAASKAFLRSLYQQYAEWGVDFVKHDCVFGDDLNVNEISTVSEILKGFEHPIVYSLSPGTHVTPHMANKISTLVNMYRITGDDWDTWNDVEGHFNVSRNFARHGLIGAQGLLGKSWPDLDMLPFGRLSSVGSNEGPHRTSNLTVDEQKTQMTLWAMAKSPLMFGGDLRNINDQTLKLITNPMVLSINAYSTNNKEISHILHIEQSLHSNPTRIQVFLDSNPIRGSKIGPNNKAGIWIANGSKTGELYMALFNLRDVTSIISVKVKDVMEIFKGGDINDKNESYHLNSTSERKCTYQDVWNDRDLGVISDKISMEIPSHGCALFVIHCS
ncbi:alpha-galactosidase isoform X1 [Cryptomeria japonica]|uniref:alpha-galactosidase isoform X1 n=2 Tax=Cryptomeria japonica TaxID=3369 RepID=UPI0027DA20CC|nr:alpha-galactosidase isoform X1 [Cryptomeria japonica]